MRYITLYKLTRIIHDLRTCNGGLAIVALVCCCCLKHCVNNMINVALLLSRGLGLALSDGRVIPDHFNPCASRISVPGG